MSEIAAWLFTDQQRDASAFSGRIERTCNHCGKTFNERWIHRLHGEETCLECCARINSWSPSRENREIPVGLMRDPIYHRLPGSVGSHER